MQGKVCHYCAIRLRFLDIKVKFVSGNESLICKDCSDKLHMLSEEERKSCYNITDIIIQT